MKKQKEKQDGIFSVVCATLVLCAMALFLHAAGMERTLPKASAAAGDTEQTGVNLPILMYHSVLKDTAKSGTYVVTPAQLESDMQYLKQHGYQTVVMQDLIDYVDGIGELPQQPVMLTFDDGYYNNLTYVLPLLQKYDMRAVISVVGSYTEQFSETPDPNPNYGHLSFDELRALADTGRVEIQNHSYDMHSLTERRGSSQKKGEPDETYRKVFCEDVGRLQTLLLEHSGLVPTTYTYPFGLIGDGTRACLEKLGFRASLTCFEKANYIVAGDAACLFGLGRYNRPAKYTTQAYLQKALGSPIK